MLQNRAGLSISWKILRNLVLAAHAKKGPHKTETRLQVAIFGALLTNPPKYGQQILESSLKSMMSCFCLPAIQICAKSCKLRFSLCLQNPVKYWVFSMFCVCVRWTVAVCWMQITQQIP